MKVKVTPFQLWHLEKLSQRDIYEADKTIEDRLITAKNSPNCEVESVYMGDEVLAVIGLSLIWPGVAEVWAITSESISKAPISFHKAVKETLDHYMFTLRLHRVHMNVPAHFKIGQRWAESLGFHCESKLAKFGPDQSDFFQYARVS
jgi:hypothetical protein